MAISPPRLPTRAPRCFNSQSDWNQYRKLAVYTANEGFTYCEDCTAATQQAMLGQGRCEHPETVFIAVSSITIGRRAQK